MPSDPLTPPAGRAISRGVPHVPEASLTTNGSPLPVVPTAVHDDAEAHDTEP